MIILLDSNYRNKEIYPFISDFAIPINTTPTSKFADNRCFYYLKQNILFSFQYISKFYDLSYYQVSSNELFIEYPIVLPSELYIVFQNFLTGFILQETVTLKSGIISICQFMPKGFYCLSEKPLFFPKMGKINIINPTENTISNTMIQFLIYGFSSFNFYPTPGYLKDYGISKNCTLVNLTKNWKISIQMYQEIYRIVVLENKPIDQNDYFIVLNPNQLNDQFESIKILKTFKDGLYKYIFLQEILDSNIILNEIFTSVTKQVSLQYIDNKFVIINPGTFLTVLEELELISDLDSQRKIVIKVTEISLSIEVESIPLCYQYPKSQYLFFFLTEKSCIPFYSYVLKIQMTQNLIFLEESYSPISSIGFVEPNFCPYGGFLMFDPFLNNLVMPLSNPTLSCYEVILTHLALPNLPVCGFDQLLSFFPYVLVNFGNTTNSSEKHSTTNSIGSLISNDPNATNVNFICPIANIRNPRIIQYVTIYSSQRVIMKLNLQDDLRFQVFLPNGNLLSYSDIYATNLRNDLIMKTNQCIHLPLNKSYQYKVFTGIDTVYITAVFMIRPLI